MHAPQESSETNISIMPSTADDEEPIPAPPLVSADDKDYDESSSSNKPPPERRKRPSRTKHNSDIEHPYIPSNEPRKARSSAPTKKPSRTNTGGSASSSGGERRHRVMRDKSGERHHHSTSGESNFDDSVLSISRSAVEDLSALDDSGISLSGEDRERRHHRRKRRPVPGETTTAADEEHEGGEIRREKTGGRRRSSLDNSGTHQKEKDNSRRRSTMDNSGSHQKETDTSRRRSSLDNSGKHLDESSRKKRPERTKSDENGITTQEEDNSEDRPRRRLPDRSKSAASDRPGRRLPDRSASSDNPRELASAGTTTPISTRERVNISRADRLSPHRRAAAADGSERSSRKTPLGESCERSGDRSSTIAERRRRRSTLLDASGADDRRRTTGTAAGTRRLGSSSGTAENPTDSPMGDISERSERRRSRRTSDAAGPGVARTQLRRHRTTEGITRGRSYSAEEPSEADASTTEGDDDNAATKKPALRRSRTADSPVRTMGRDRRASRRPTSNQTSAAQALINAVDLRDSRANGVVKFDPLGNGQVVSIPYVPKDGDDDDDSDEESESQSDDNKHASPGSFDHSNGDVDASGRGSGGRRGLKKIIPAKLRRLPWKSSSKSTDETKTATEDDSERTYDLDD